MGLRPRPRFPRSKPKLNEKTLRVTNHVRGSDQKSIYATSFGGYHDQSGLEGLDVESFFLLLFLSRSKAALDITNMKGL
jgi:hypothetical protein